MSRFATEEKVTTVRINEKILANLLTPARHHAIYGGRGSAKSWSVATWLAIEASKQRKKRFVCARQFQNSIRDSSKSLLEKRIDTMGLNNQFRITEREIIHVETGTVFMFVGLERSIDSIRSLEGADIVWIEEARTIKAKSMEILLPTVRQAGSSLIWTWNPEEPDDPVDAYFRNGPPPPRSVVTFVDYTNNPYFYSTELSQEMEVLKQGNYERYKHVWLGAYDTASESKVFPNVTVGRVPVPANCPPRYGLDFGFGVDPSCITKTYYIPENNIIYIAAEAFGRVAMDALPNLVRSILYKDNDLIKADSSQPGTIEFLNSRGFNISGATKGPGSVKAGINFISGYKIIIDPDCENMREEARLYSYMTDRITGKVLPGKVPVDADNHGWDSVRYALEDCMTSPPLADNDSGVIRLKRW